jgi:maleate isomerase
MAEETVAGLVVSPDLLFASCTNFRAVDALPELERVLGLPAISSNQAVLEAVLLRHGLSWPAAAA